MKALIKMIVTLVVIYGLAACHDEAEWNIRLADELVYTHPDSSLTLLQQIDTTTLRSSSSRAYYALMWTQTAFRTNRLDLVNDSLAQAAYEYYNFHDNEREKLVRAMIYLGLQYQQKQDDDAALLWYKKAESTVATNDYRNQGQINLRIGKLFSKHNHFFNDEEMRRYQKALDCYKKVGDTIQIIYCLLGTGAMYRTFGIDSAQNNLILAYSLSKEINNKTLAARSLEYLARGYLKDSLHHIAKELSLLCIKQYPKEEQTIDAMFDASASYGLIGKNDSAQYFLDLAPLPDANEERSSMRLFCEKIIAQNQHNLQQFVTISEKRDFLNDSLRGNPTLQRLIDIDRRVSDNLSQQRIEEQTNLRHIVLAIFVLTVILGLHIGYYLKKREKERIALLKEQIAELTIDHANLEHTIEQMSSSGPQLNARLTELLSAYSGLCNSLIDMSTAMDERTFMKKFKKTVADFTERGELLHELQKYIDENNDNVLTKLFETYPEIKGRDRDIVILTALQMPSTNIEVCLGMAPKGSTLRVSRMRLAKKMGLTIPLVDYLKTIVKNRPQF